MCRKERVIETERQFRAVYNGSSSNKNNQKAPIQQKEMNEKKPLLLRFCVSLPLLSRAM